MERYIGIRILALGLVFCVLGCERNTPQPATKPADDNETAKKYKPDDPLANLTQVQFVPAADGTVYCILRAEACYWLVDGEATEVTSKDGPSEELGDIDGRANSGTTYSDANGGVYVSTNSHMWYLKDGRMKKVSVVDRASLANPSPKASDRTLLWAVGHYRDSLLRGNAFRRGEETGYDAGRDEGRREGRGEGRE